MNNEELVKELVDVAGFSREAALVGVRAGFACEYCGRYLLDSIDDYDIWEQDHIVPVSKTPEPPKEDASHMALACRLCNKIKRAWAPEGVTELERHQKIDRARELIFQGRAEKVRLVMKIREILRRHGSL